VFYDGGVGQARVLGGGFIKTAAASDAPHADVSTAAAAAAG
jgi:hypothetical protein